MLDHTRGQLQDSYALIKAGRVDEAFLILKPILERQPENAEAWWLFAHAAPTAADSVAALNQVLKFKPRYEAAEQMLREQELQSVRELSEDGQRAEAYVSLKAILARRPESAEGWWLAAQIAPMRSEAVAACQRVLMIDPTHIQAQDMLADHQALLKSTLMQKERAVGQTRANPKRRAGCTLALVALLILSLGSTLVFMSLTGNTFGLPLGKQFSSRSKLGNIGKAPSVQVGTLLIGATNEYQFNVSANSELLVSVTFVLSSKAAGKALKLYDPDGALIAVGSESKTSNISTLNAFVTRGGQYTVRLVGTAGTAQGVYSVQLVSAGLDMILPPSP